MDVNLLVRLVVVGVVFKESKEYVISPSVRILSSLFKSSQFKTSPSYSHNDSFFTFKSEEESSSRSS